MCDLLGKNGWHIGRESWIYKFVKVEILCNCIEFCLISSFFNDHFLLFVIASVSANHKTTVADVLNKIAGVLKYAPDKIVAGSRGKTADND